ncbi:MAG TPA: hypothetical protein VED40_05285 [Azospirillaceae bacterium]|nr:hypothetical protein [Azospirillaceae bacterium]
MTDLLIVLGTAAAAFLIRALVTYGHRAVLREGMHGDASIHFAILRQFAKDPRSRYIDSYLIRCEPMTYPTAFHRACAVIPLEVIRRHPWVPSFILYVLAAAAYAAYLLHVQRLVFGGIEPVSLAAALFIYAALPTNWTFVGPGIAYFTLSARYFARLFSSAFFIFAVVGSLYGDAVSMGLAVIAAAVGFLAAMFSRQTLMFVTPLLALFSLDPLPLLELAAGYVLAAAVSPRDLPLSMRHTFIQWRLYPKLHKKSEVARAALVNFPNWARLWRERTDVAAFVRRIARAEPLSGLLRHPDVAVSLLLSAAALSGADPAARQVAAAFLPLILAALIVYLATTSPRLDHLGESYRYIEYSLLFVTPTVIGLLLRRVDPTAAVLGYAWFAAIVTLTPLIAYRLLSRWVWQPKDELREFIDRLPLPQGAVVLPVGLQIAGNVCARRDDVKSFWYQPGLISEEIYRDYIEVWPFLKLDPTAIMVRHGVTHAIADKHLLSLLPAPYRLPGMRRIGESERYIAFESVAPADAPGGVGEVLMPER